MASALDKQLSALTEERQKLKRFISRKKDQAATRQKTPKISTTDKINNLKKSARKVATVAVDSLEKKVLNATVVKG